jgi:hypothetical protein
MTRVNFDQILENSLKQSVIFNYKITFNEAGAFVEYVVIGLNVETVSVLERVIVFYFILDHEGHVTEWERKELVQNQPIVIFTV